MILGVLDQGDRNYLRVRGEYFISSMMNPYDGELPPRARRILAILAFQTVDPGTTSACAENTEEMPDTEEDTRNYLRVRGEYKKPSNTSVISLELPPRARRIP